MTEPLWLIAARKELGVREVPGRPANPRILEYFRASGHETIMNDETAWCSAFINWAMKEAKIRGTMALNARSWATWGKPSKERVGAICVFSRGSISWQGHVGILLSWTATRVKVLGGNQSDGVTAADYPRARLIAMRWPATMQRSRTVQAAAGGTVATVASSALEMATEAQGMAQQLVEYLEWAKYIALGLVVVCFGMTMYFKWTDVKQTRVEDET